MALDVTDLPDYVDQSSLDQIMRDFLMPNFTKRATAVPNVKSAYALHKIASAPVPQVGGDCAFNASGGTTLTKRNLVSSPVKWQDNICLATLDTKYTQMMNTAGQDYSNSPVQKPIMDSIYGEISEGLGTSDWNGTVAGTAKYDGLHTVLSAETLVNANFTSYIPGGTALTEVNETNADKVVMALINAMVANKPGVYATNPTVEMPLSWFNYLNQRLVALNYFHVVPNQAGDVVSEGYLTIPGYTNIKVYGHLGLEGEDTAYMLNFKKNVYFGYDKDESAENTSEMWYSKDQQTHKYSIRIRRGWQVAYTNEVIKFTIPGS